MTVLEAMNKCKSEGVTECWVKEINGYEFYMDYTVIHLSQTKNILKVIKKFYSEMYWKL